jgi:linoleoyl-CoA desaturase
MKAFEKRKLKYESKDTANHIFKQIRAKADQYFLENNYKKSGNTSLFVKIIVLGLLLVPGYYAVLHSSSLLTMTLSFLVFGFVFLIVGINVGHDAAHHCVTGNHKVDDFLFNLVYGLQGLSGHYWQIRHNTSHHIFPNVIDNDSDLEAPAFLLLHPHQKAKKYHKYQHLYAPFVYATFSLLFIFVIDFTFIFRKEQANLRFNKIPAIAIIKLIVAKVAYLTLWLLIPIYFAPASAGTIVLAFLLMHLMLSIFVAFTFFISHHVQEVDYVEADMPNELVHDAWTHHQVITTIDFSINNPFANFIFGGFNLHIAHHLFPEVSHIHYPALTKIIKETFEENNVDWYRSFTFFEGVGSHLRHLKETADHLLKEQEGELAHQA